jgi:hypothetical protein
MDHPAVVVVFHVVDKAEQQPGTLGVQVVRLGTQHRLDDRLELLHRSGGIAGAGAAV